MSRKRFFLSVVLSVLLCASSVLSGKADATMWTQTYGGPANDYAYSLVETPDGGYAIAGTTEIGAGAGDFWLVKTDAFGNVEWNQTYGGTGDDRGSSVVNASDGGYAIVGTTESFGAGGKDFWLVKTDELGTVQWNMTYGGAGDDAASSLVETADGGYAIAGAWNYSISLVTSSFGDAWLVKTNAFGDMEWNQTYGRAAIVASSSLVKTPDGGYAIAGYTYSPSAGWDFWLGKTDAFGNMEWNQTYGGTGADSASSLVATSDGGYALAGYTSSFGAGAWDFWLVKTDAAGNMQWNQTYGGTTDDAAYSLVETRDGGYALAGYTASFGAGLGDFWLVKTDAAGNMQWNQTYGGEDWEEARSLVATSDGGYALAGANHSMMVLKTLISWWLRLMNMVLLLLCQRLHGSFYRCCWLRLWLFLSAKRNCFIHVHKTRTDIENS